MAKRRLSQEKRDIILHTIRTRVENVRFKHLRDEATAIDDKIRARALVLCEKHFPPEEMRILRKHKVASSQRALTVVAISPTGSQRHESFLMSEERDQPLTRRAVIDWDDEIFDLHKQLEAKDKEWHKAVKEVMDDYRAFVNECKYFEDVVAIIPEVADLEKKLFGETRALTVVSKDVIARIKADQEALA